MPAAKKTTEETEELKAQNLLTQNMRFYSRVMNTPKDAQKSFNNGRFSGTDVNPMYRIKKLTELFGPAGIGWWTQNEKFEPMVFEKTGEIAIFCTLELVYVDPETGVQSKPVTGVGGNMFVVQRKSGLQLSDEAYKMAYTDALSIACKALGFLHDIYYQNDKTKYTMDDISNQAEVPQDNSAQIAELQARIQKGIQALTNNMNASQKNEFLNNVIVPIIGQPDYKSCKDIGKLTELLNKLLAMFKKTA